MYVSSASCKSTGSGQFCTHQGVALLGDLALLPVSSLVPRPSPNFPSLAVRLNRTTSNGKLGEGLGTRLTSVFYIHTTCTIMIFMACEDSAWHILPASYTYPGDALLMKHYQTQVLNCVQSVNHPTRLEWYLHLP